MEFRPCIDIHNGQVKQIIGGSLRDEDDFAKENFVAAQDAAFFAKLYQNAGIKGGHIILLNDKKSPFYEATVEQALSALSAYPRHIAGECASFFKCRSVPCHRDILCVPGRQDTL